MDITLLSSIMIVANDIYNRRWKESLYAKNQKVLSHALEILMRIENGNEKLTSLNGNSIVDYLNIYCSRYEVPKDLIEGHLIREERLAYYCIDELIKLISKDRYIK